MRKHICLLLILWLPCFVMAANVMSLQMALAQQSLSTTVDRQMPCHQHAAEHAHTQATAQHSPPHQAPMSHHCTVCGFCLVSAGLAHLNTFPQVILSAQPTSTPLFEADPVHTQTYPPAIKPPIFS
ncbi:hypothetical protein [Methylophilus medardicus]|uniref:DUF2946 domain-containing protein n=1 Tax=Methylophilus medardicus TaxID=2588534 RepID=A0A5B8CTS3_9PROT|nr:hypothetical protein [Methylophilus medardicus]QDC44456.1 hypothetical protein FIU01_07920 [Methylophilus medardicus]QDC49463.1 hypothetical protein FIU00_07920 [Methylophilus medardicus]QDC53168.1 hypothetical protein FIT99_07920 [Methylophilus medardicus]